MDLTQATLLGVVQGATEYLPVSSSAHLVLVPAFLGWEKNNEQVHFLFDVLVQLGTLIGVFVYFWKDLMEVLNGVLKGLRSKDLFQDPGAKLGLHLAIATLPAVVIGLLFKDRLEAFFSNEHATLYFLMFTAAILFGAEALGKDKPEVTNTTWKMALAIGFAQALALFPGVSRSGSTVAAGMFLGVRGQAPVFVPDVHPGVAGRLIAGRPRSNHPSHLGRPARSAAGGLCDLRHHRLPGRGSCLFETAAFGPSGCIACSLLRSACSLCNPTSRSSERRTRAPAKRFDS